jgi:hypothetical protein
MFFSLSPIVHSIWINATLNVSLAKLQPPVSSYKNKTSNPVTAQARCQALARHCLPEGLDALKQILASDTSQKCLAPDYSRLRKPSIMIYVARNMRRDSATLH